jgi:GTPase SAR1 family protein
MLEDNFDPFAAVYQDEQVTDYAGNPLIEALPAELTPFERNTMLERRPALPTQSELNQGAHHRFHYVGRIRDLVLSLPEYIYFEPHVSMMIRQGYIARNPMSDSAWARVWRANVNLLEKRRLPSNTKAAETILFCGLSGTGKSTFINRVLSSYPQIIQHTEYKGKPLVLQQISWLKVDCPRDGTPTGLCKNFFASMDRLLGTRYSEEVYSKFKAVDYMNLMGRIASNHFLGVLVLDELQHLSIRKSGGEKGLLDQLAAMFEVLEIPIIYIGTPSVTKLIEKKLQNVRRSSSLGCQWFERPDSDSDVNWIRFMDGLWEYQWTSQKTKLTPKLRAAFYDHCQGITFFAIAMFTLCQYRLITDDDGSNIDASLLADIAANELLLLQPAVRALRSGDPRKLEEFEDLMCEIREDLGSVLRIPNGRAKAPKVKSTPKATAGLPSQRSKKAPKKNAPDSALLNELAKAFPTNALDFGND